MEINKDFFIRSFKEDDYLLINKWRNDEHIQKFTCGPIRSVSLEIEKQWVYEQMTNNRNNIYLAICLNDVTQKMVGYMSLNNIDYLNRSARAGGIVIGDKSATDGLLSFDSLLYILDYSFNQLNLHRVTGDCLKEHPFSPILLEILGFKLEGIARNAIFKYGEYKDVLKFSILKDEYLENKANGNYKQSSIIKQFVKIRKKRKIAQ